MRKPSAADRLRATVKAWAAPRGRQAELARRLGVRESSISKWLNGGDTDLDLDDISRATGLDVSELFASVSIKDQKGPLNTKDVSLPDTPSGVTSALPNEGVSVHAVSIQADPLQSRADLQRTYDDINATIGTLIDQIDTLVAARLRLASLLGRTDDSEQSHGTQSPQTGVGGMAERRSGADAGGGQKAAPLRRTGVR